jgi:hypothetical protein
MIGMDNKFTSLHDDERSLLMSYHDNDSDIRHFNLIDRWRLKRVLSLKPEAKEYLELLRHLSTQLTQALVDDELPLKTSLWKQIEQRIDQEERAALYLGKRELGAEHSEPSRLFNIPEFSWGLSGVTTAGFGVLLMLSFFLNNTFRHYSTGFLEKETESVIANRVADMGGSAPAPVRFASQQNDLPQIIEPTRRGPQTLSSIDVDWVHSDGAVRFFSDPNRNSTMIWVKKRSPVVRYFGPGMGTESNRDSVNPGNVAQLVGAAPRSSLNNQRR